MGVFLKFVNADDLFRSRAKNPVIINYFNSTSQSHQDHLKNMIYTSHEGDVLTNEPSCECGAEHGNAHIRFYQGRYRGTLCLKCGTEVRRKAEHSLEPLIWIRAPEGVKSLISPQAWIMMKKRLTKSGVELVRWICDTSYVPIKKIPALYELEGEMAAHSPRLERGLNNFIDHYEEYLDILFSLRSLRNKEKDVMPDGRDPLHVALLKFKDDLLWEYMPLPNRALLLIEKTHMGTYVDLNIKEAVDAVNVMKGIDSPLFNYDLRTKQNRAVKAISVLADFYKTFYTDTLAKKPGLFRKQVFGGRSHFSFRSVITSITDAHDYDEIHLPWGIAVAVFRIHIESVLLKQGKKPGEITSLLNEYAHRYHPGLYTIMMDFIMQSPYRTNGAIGKSGIPCIMQRNPTLEMASAQYVLITDIKSDTDDQTVSISILSVRGLNADFDGDQINFMLGLDEYVNNYLKRLAGYKSTFGLDAPRKVSGNLAMPKPVTATIANWLEGTEEDQEDTDPAAVERMDRMLELA